MVESNNKIISEIISLLPDHKYFCELWGSGVSLFFNKTSLKTEIYNDLSNGLVDFFQVMREPKLCCQFHEVFLECEKEEPDEIVQNAYVWFTEMRLNFPGVVVRDNKLDECSWIAVMKNMILIYERFKTVQIECYPWQKILHIYNISEYLMFGDCRDVEGIDYEKFCGVATQYPAMVVLLMDDKEFADKLEEKEWNKQCVGGGQLLLHNSNAMAKIEKCL